MSWNQFSESKLLGLEQKILSVLKTAYNTFFVRIKWGKDSEEKIWTISMNTESKNTPLVLLHGFAAGIGFWVRNLDSLAKDRPVYAMDILGFGRSSRPEFNADSLEAEQQLVDSVEEWRKQMNLEKFILLGHSMGGFLAASYAISHPEHVKHLILADPWGFEDKALSPPRDHQLSYKFRVLRVILYPFTNLNPLAAIRALGPMGPWLIQRVRGDIINKFDDIIDDKTIIPNYIYHCNAQKPSGETAFHNMIQGFGWAKNPMIHRIKNLNEEIPITFFYGSNTWMVMQKEIGPKIKEIRPNSFVDIQVIEMADHHLYADRPEAFNDLIVNTCNDVDAESDIQFLSIKKGNRSLKIENQKAYEEETIH